MTKRLLRSASLALAPIALIVTALALVAIAPQSAVAGELCADFDGVLCLTVTPDPDTNPIGTEHTVTAVVTLDGDPLKASADEILFFVISGPNTGQNATQPQVESATATFTYTGSGGTGTDQIAAILCETDICDEIASCLETNVLCIEKVEAVCGLAQETPGPDVRAAAGNGKGSEFCFGPAYANKTWEDPTPSPSPTPIDVGAGGQTPAPTPAQLPQSGGDDGGSGTPWSLAILSGGAVLAAGAALLVAKRRTSKAIQDS